MPAGLSEGLVRKALDEYERLKPSIERQHFGEYIVVEPISKDYFIDSILGRALRAAKTRYPDRLFYTIRIGYESAIQVPHG